MKTLEELDAIHADGDMIQATEAVYQERTSSYSITSINCPSSCHHALHLPSRHGYKQQGMAKNVPLACGPVVAWTNVSTQIFEMQTGWYLPCAMSTKPIRLLV